MNQIFSIIGAITGSLSLLGLAYFLGIWRGQVDKDRESFRDCIKLYPPAEMWTMVKTLWDVYVLDALRNRPDLAEKHSAYKLKKEGEDLIPDDIKQALEKISSKHSSEDVATGWLVVKELGTELIAHLAEEKQLSLQEAIAILSTYVGR